MLRTVKAFDNGDSCFFLLCDHRQCMEARRGPAIVANVDDYRLSKKTFLEAAMSEGWVLDLEGAFCPFHAREMMHAVREAAEKGKQIVEAQPQHVRAFGKGRV